MAESSITLNAGSGGSVLDTFNVGAGSTHRQVVVLGDPTTTANVATINANGSLVVQGSQASRTAGTITSAASVVGPVAVTQYNVVTFSISGTYAGVTFIIEASDDGTNYYPLQVINNATGQVGSTWTPGSNATATYDAAIGGYTYVRARATAWTSGTANVGVTPQTFAYDPVVGSVCQGVAASGTTIAGYPVLMGGTYTSTLPTVTTGQAVNVQTTARGEQLVAISSGATAVAVKAASTAAAATDPALVVALSPNLGPAITTNALQACSVGLASSLTVLNIKASAGNVMGCCVQNPNASVIYLQFYNTSGTPTLGTSVVYWIPIPASGTVFLPPGTFALSNHATGIGIGASTTPTSTGTPGTAPNVVIFYK